MLTSLLLLYSRVWKTSLIEGYQQETKFLANFAFSASTADDPSTIKLRAWTFMDHQKVLLFENDDWFFTQGLPCADRGRAAFMNATVPPGRYYGEAMDVVERQFVQPRPSYVFLLLARCSEWAASSAANSHDACTGRRPDGEPIPNGVFLYFHLEMTNPGGYWSKHFSADEQGLFEFHTTMLVAYISLFVVYIVMYTTRWDDEAFVYKIEVFSAVLFCCSAYHGLMVAHYLEYAYDGIGRPWCVATAEAAEALSTILFTLLLLLISKGWMVSKMRLKRKTRLLQMCVTIALTGLHTLLFVLEYVNRDPAECYHTYESSSARVLVILRLFITGWFVVARIVRTTMISVPTSGDSLALSASSAAVGSSLCLYSRSLRPIYQTTRVYATLSSSSTPPLTCRSARSRSSPCQESRHLWSGPYRHWPHGAPSCRAWCLQMAHRGAAVKS